MEETLVVAAMLVAAGVVGILLPVVPGLSLVLAGIAVWAVPRNDPLGWIVLAIATVIVVVGSVARYLVPGKRMRDSGVPGRSIAAGSVLGILGFFLIPVFGLFVGFPAGVYAAERWRLGDRREAWPSTRTALAAVGLSILVELATGLLAVGVWIFALIFLA